jgi:hypothetical protein
LRAHLARAGVLKRLPPGYASDCCTLGSPGGACRCACTIQKSRRSKRDKIWGRCIAG